MKIGILRAIAHNVADSLGSGFGLLIGVYEMDVFGEAKTGMCMVATPVDPKRGIVHADYTSMSASAAG